MNPMFIYVAVNERKSHCLGSFIFPSPYKDAACPADGMSDPSCQARCLQRWAVPGVCGALPMAAPGPMHSARQKGQISPQALQR